MTRDSMNVRYVSCAATWATRYLENGRVLVAMSPNSLLPTHACTSPNSMPPTHAWHARHLTVCSLQALSTISSSRQPNVVITNKVSPTLPTVKGDAQRLCQILLNILGNAVKFTPQGFIEVDARVAADQATVAISVRDTGCGIASQDIDNIFLPFAQGDERV
jgi:signal transduction histidine kinase